MKLIFLTFLIFEKSMKNKGIDFEVKELTPKENREEKVRNPNQTHCFPLIKYSNYTKIMEQLLGYESKQW